MYCVKDRIIDLDVQDLAVEVALLLEQCTSKRRDRPALTFLFRSSCDISLQYSQSWGAYWLRLFLSGPVLQHTRLREHSCFLIIAIVFTDSIIIIIGRAWGFELKAKEESTILVSSDLGMKEQQKSSQQQLMMHQKQFLSIIFLIVYFVLGMHGISSCVIKTLQHLPRVAATSGHFAFQYGSYDACLEAPDYRYHMIEFDVMHLTKGITMGICLPKQCSNRLVTTVLTEAFKLSGTPIYIYRVVTDPQNYQFPYHWTFYLTLLILLLLAGMVAVASLRKRREGWLKGFSIQDNMSLLLAKRESNLRVFDGVRVLTLMWVIMGNTFINSIIGAINVLTIDFVFQRPFILIVECALLTVDIFFFIGGFFIAYKFAHKLAGPLINYPLLVLKRALRYLPAYIMVILVWYSMFMHLGNGPKWIPDEEYTALCKNMWRTVLFVDNLVNNGHTLCMSWAFYMQVEFQVFLCSLVLLLIYSRSKGASLLVAAGLVAYSWTINLIYTEQNKQQYPISFKALSNYQNYIFDIFIKPHTRWTPYFFGIFIGLAYADYTNSKEKQTEITDTFRKASLSGKIAIVKDILERRRFLRIGIQWFGIAIMAFVTFFPRMLQLGYQWSQAFHSMCLNFGRSLYPFAICLVILPTMLGVKGSFFRTVLDTPFFNFMSRISYCTYLFHGLVILYISGTKRYDTYFSITDLYINSLAVIVLSYFFGLVTTLLVEMPFHYIIQRIIGQKTRDPSLKTDKDAVRALNSEKSFRRDQESTEAEEINRTLLSQREV